MIANGFKLLGLWEYMHPNLDSEPGSWQHFTPFAPPWLDTIWENEKE